MISRRCNLVKRTSVLNNVLMGRLADGTLRSLLGWYSAADVENDDALARTRPN